MFRDATRAVQLVAAAMSSAQFDAAALEARAGDGWTTLTELADTLVREHGLPFRKAHAIAGAFRRRPAAPSANVRWPRCWPTRRPRCSARRSTYSEAQLTHILSPRHFVEIRKTFGGPAPEETARAARASRAQLEADEAWWTGATDALAKAEQTLAERSAAL